MTKKNQSLSNEFPELNMTDAQKFAVRVLCYSCHATQGQLLEMISEREFRELKESGCIEKTKATKFEGKYQNTFKLTKVGQDEAKYQLHVKVFYGSKARYHNLYLTDHLMKKPLEVLFTANTEGQNKRGMTDWIGSKSYLDEQPMLLAMKKKGKISAPDVSYTENGQLIYFDVSNDYKQEEIRAKYTYAQMRGAKPIIKEVGERNLAKIKKFGEDWWV